MVKRIRYKLRRKVERPSKDAERRGTGEEADTESMTLWPLWTSFAF